MALAPADLIAPVGELESELFPDGSLTDRVAAYLVEAQGRTSDEAAQAAWVYYRAYTAAVVRLSALPSSESLLSASRAYSQGQIARLQARADYHKAAYDSLTEVLAAPQPPASVSVSNEAVW